MTEETWWRQCDWVSDHTQQCHVDNGIASIGILAYCVIVALIIGLGIRARQ
jgi:hypothetical protein